MTERIVNGQRRKLVRVYGQRDPALEDKRWAFYTFQPPSPEVQKLFRDFADCRQYIERLLYGTWT